MGKYRIVEYTEPYSTVYTIEFKFLWSWLPLRTDYYINSKFSTLDAAKEFLKSYITSGKKVVFETDNDNFIDMSEK